MNRELIYIYNWFIFTVTYLSVLPAHTTYIMIYMTHTCVKYLTPTKNLNLQFDLSSLWPTCQSSPHTPHTSWHTGHIHLSNIWLPQRKLVKCPTLLRQKTRFLSRCNPGRFDPKFQQTHSPMRWDISKKKMRLMPHDFSLQRPRGATTNLYCFCFYFLFRKGHHCGNKLFPASVSVILTGKPIADQTPPKIACSNGHRSLLGFAAKVMSRDKFWKQDFCMNTLFKFVRVVVKDRLTNLEQRWSGLSLLRVGLQG